MKKQSALIMITSIIGLTVLMMFMFKGIKEFTENTKEEAEAGIQVLSMEKQEVPFTSLIVGVVDEIKDDKLTIFDIQKRRIVTTTIHELKEIKDERGKAILLNEIRVGEIVEISYEPTQDNLLSIIKSGKSWIKTDLKNLKIDKLTSSIYIGSNMYHYTENTLILDKEGNKVNNIHILEAYDTLELIGMKDQVYSIRILEEQGFIQLKDLPVLEGTVEIDINRRINLDEVSGPIAVSVGAHKIEVHLKGYEPLVKTVTVGEKETVTIMGSEVKKAKSPVQYNVNLATEPTGADVYINGQYRGVTPYSTTLEIGEYYIELKKEGYEIYQTSLVVDNSDAQNSYFYVLISKNE